MAGWTRGRRARVVRVCQEGEGIVQPVVVTFCTSDPGVISATAPCPYALLALPLALLCQRSTSPILRVEPARQDRSLYHASFAACRLPRRRRLGPAPFQFEPNTQKAITLTLVAPLLFHRVSSLTFTSPESAPPLADSSTPRTTLPSRSLSPTLTPTELPSRVLPEPSSLSSDRSEPTERLTTRSTDSPPRLVVRPSPFALSLEVFQGLITHCSLCAIQSSRTSGLTPSKQRPGG